MEFESEVAAYPAITIISKAQAGATCTAAADRSDAEYLLQLKDNLIRQSNHSAAKDQQSSIASQGSAPWILSSCNKSDLIRRLEQTLPTLEQTGCKAGIGVATGADHIFIDQYDDIDVEESRKLPLATTRDIATGQV